MQRAEHNIGLLRRSEAASHGPGEEFIRELSASTGMDEVSIRMLYQQTNDQLRANLDRSRIYYWRHGSMVALIELLMSAMLQGRAATAARSSRDMRVD